MASYFSNHKTSSQLNSSCLASGHVSENVSEEHTAALVQVAVDNKQGSNLDDGSEGKMNEDASVVSNGCENDNNVDDDHDDNDVELWYYWNLLS